MDKRLQEIYDSTIPHSSFLSQSSIVECMHQSYQLGVEDIFEWLQKKGYSNDDLKELRSEWWKRTNQK